MRQGSGGKDIFKYRWIHQQCGNGWKVINITLIPLLGILETNSLSERIWLRANPQQYVQRKISLHSRKILVEGLVIMKPHSLCRFSFTLLSLPFPFSVCRPLSQVCRRLPLPPSAPSPPAPHPVVLSPFLSGLDCAVKVVIVCLCVISSLNEGRVNEINFSCAYMLSSDS